MGLEINGVQSFDLGAVQEIVAQTTISITTNMINALMDGLKEGLNFKGLAEKHIVLNFEEELAKTDEKTQRVFQKIISATKEHIQAHSQPLVMTFAMINQQTQNETSSEMFLKSFALPEIKLMVKTLESEQSTSLECIEIWS